AANNHKLYVNRKEGFIGYGLKKDEYLEECSDLDDIIAFRKDGKMMVVRIQDKVFVGKDILYAGVFRKSDSRMVYNLAYVDGGSGRTMSKRFNVTAITRDKEYNLAKSDKGSKVLYFTANPNGEAELITVYLTAGAKARKKVFDFDFADIEIKGRGAGGNILTKYPVRKIDLKALGKSTLGGLNIWYDETIGRLNTDNRGVLLGNFQADDKVICFYKDGQYELTSFEVSNRYNAQSILKIEKFNPESPVSVVYIDGASKFYYVKRFQIEALSLNKPYKFISEEKGSKIMAFATWSSPQVEVNYKKKGEKTKSTTTFDLNDLIDVKGWKSAGNRFPVQTITSMHVIEPIPEIIEIPVIEPEPESTESTEVQEPKTEEKSSAVSSDFIDHLKEEIIHEVEEEEESLPSEKKGTKPDENGLDIGTSIDLDIKNRKKKDDGDSKDQLGLFE
ncbi:MAG: topoisomerase-4 subunit A, partial [Bacteroidia bacterium]